MSTRTIFGSGEFLRGNDRAGGSLDPEAVRAVFARITEVTAGTSEVVASTQGPYDRQISNVQRLQIEDNERRRRQVSPSSPADQTTRLDADKEVVHLDEDVQQRHVDNIYDQIHGEG